MDFVSQPGFEGRMHGHGSMREWSGFQLASPAQTKKERPQPRPLLQPPPRGTIEQHPARRSLAGAWCQVAASIVQEPCGSGWSVSGKQKLDAHASIRIVSY